MIIRLAMFRPPLSKSENLQLFIGAIYSHLDRSLRMPEWNLPVILTMHNQKGTGDLIRHFFQAQLLCSATASSIESFPNTHMV